jgi:hypothetical protein
MLHIANFLLTNELTSIFQVMTSIEVRNHKAFIHDTYLVVPCPANSIGTDVPSGCVCGVGFFGTVTPATTSPYYQCNCTGSTHTF